MRVCGFFFEGAGGRRGGVRERLRPGGAETDGRRWLCLTRRQGSGSSRGGWRWGGGRACGVTPATSWWGRRTWPLASVARGQYVAGPPSSAKAPQRPRAPRRAVPRPSRLGSTLVVGPRLTRGDGVGMAWALEQPRRWTDTYVGHFCPLCRFGPTAGSAAHIATPRLDPRQWVVTAW